MDYRYNFDDNKKNNKKRSIFVVVFLILIIIITSFLFKNNSNAFFNKVSNIVVYPFEMLYNVTKNTTSEISTYFSDKEKVNYENKILEAENLNLKLQILESQKILDENNSLKEMVEIKKKYQHFEIKLSNIIYREHDNWTQTFRIDVGFSDGIKINQAVVHSDGLVGFISEVKENTSTVTTILDPIASVSVNISTINEPAILQGDLTLKSENKLKLNYIPIDTEVSISDMLYTSGLGSTYPSSIPVGKIVEIVNSKNDINRYAIVEPSVNIRTISEVAIIIN